MYHIHFSDTLKVLPVVVKMFPSSELVPCSSHVSKPSIPGFALIYLRPFLLMLTLYRDIRIKLLEAKKESIAHLSLHKTSGVLCDKTVPEVSKNIIYKTAIRSAMT